MKKCPKCGDVVSCLRWHYGDKMCRKCSGREKSRRQRKEKSKYNSNI